MIKDDHIGSAFLDAGASQFLLESARIKETSPPQPPGTGPKEPHDDEGPARKRRRKDDEGASIGPGWTDSLLESGKEATGNNVVVRYLSEVTSIESAPEGGDQWALQVALSNGEVVGCDFVVSATGVEPNVEFCGTEFKRDPEGGLLVNKFMETSVPDVFAAGDACSAGWEQSPHWFQMRLWSQARITGLTAARSILTPTKERSSDFSFEIFTHLTRFFGFKVILLGL